MMAVEAPELCSCVHPWPGIEGARFRSRRVVTSCIHNSSYAVILSARGVLSPFVSPHCRSLYVYSNYLPYFYYRAANCCCCTAQHKRALSLSSLPSPATDDPPACIVPGMWCLVCHTTRSSNKCTTRRSSSIYFNTTVCCTPFRRSLSQDTFYIDPMVEGCEDLVNRARRLGLKTKGFLGADVTVCVAAAAGPAGDRSREEAAAAGAAAAAGQSRSRRRDRIHRMVR